VVERLAVMTCSILGVLTIGGAEKGENVHCEQRRNLHAQARHGGSQGSLRSGDRAEEEFGGEATDKADPLVLSSSEFITCAKGLCLHPLEHYVKVKQNRCHRFTKD
jgi:hypothetical protein